MFRNRLNFILGAALTLSAGICSGLPASALAQGNTANNTPLENSCRLVVGPKVGKLAFQIARELGRCQNADLRGTFIGVCPNQVNTDKIKRFQAKIVRLTEKKCGSLCSVSKSLTCVDDQYCPPTASGTETCGVDGEDAFSAANMGFPGPYCPALLGDPKAPRTITQLGECWAAFGRKIGENLNANVYGTLRHSDSPSQDAVVCAGKIAVGFPKAANKIANALVKCRVKIDGDPDSTTSGRSCRESDVKTKRKVDRTIEKFGRVVQKKCTDSQIQELDLCGNGIGGTLDRDEAIACLSVAVEEAAHTPGTIYEKEYITASLIDGVFPSEATPICGDGLVNQGPDQFLMVGEECDLNSDSKCRGQCAPPGDFWECTCLNIARNRRLADGTATDLDTGWTGTSHDSTVTDGAGYVTTRRGCDCHEFDPLKPNNCISPSADPVCEDYGRTAPRCSDDFNSARGCDDRGNRDGVHDDDDCSFCDLESLNTGDYCTDDSDCTSQCIDLETYDGTGIVCVDQSDCAAGTVCLGRCDDALTCEKMNNGAPLPLAAGGTAVCVVSQFFTDVVGTTNIVTGEHEQRYELRSITYNPANGQEVPCPVCGGFCVGGARDGQLCSGRCNGPGAEDCLLDIDCPSGEACMKESPDCPVDISGEAGFCQTDLICSHGGRRGQSCRVEAATDFGGTSAECPPDPNSNISGNGLAITFAPSTSEPIDFHSALNMGPCSGSGWSNFDCPCPAGFGGRPTQPNQCRPACNAGPEWGLGCQTGPTGASSGNFTRCDGGSNDNRTCDEDTDCPGGSCSRNPMHCVKGAANKLQTACANDAACDTAPGSGDGICADACPTGRCVPLCGELGACDAASDNAGANCLLDNHCEGGLCGPGDPEEGACVAGPPLFHCNGDKKDFIICQESQAGTRAGCEWGPNGVEGDVDDIPGAGECISDFPGCFVNDAQAEGGDIFNGRGDSTNFHTVALYCVPPSTNIGVNLVGGVGGPGRLRQDGVNVPNYTRLR